MEGGPPRRPSGRCPLSRTALRRRRALRYVELQRRARREGVSIGVLQARKQAFVAMLAAANRTRYIAHTPEGEWGCEAGLCTMRSADRILSSSPAVAALTAPFSSLKRTLCHRDLSPPFVAIRFAATVFDPAANRSSILHELRQRELLTALGRTARHPGVWQVHLLVESRPAFARMLRRLRWPLPARVTRVVELGRLPLNVDLFLHAAREAAGEYVLVSNDDVYPDGDGWLMPPDGALLLSRHAKRNESCEGCAALGAPSCNAERAQDVKSLCNARNFGSFDAWVSHFRPGEAATLRRTALDLLRTPRHAFGADNVLGFVFERHLGRPVRNRCHSYRLYHLHCTFRTSLTVTARDNDRGYGERTFIPHHHLAKMVHAAHNDSMTWHEAVHVTRRRWRAVY